MIAPRVRTRGRPSAGKGIPRLDPSLEQPTDADPPPAPNSSATHGAAAFIDAEQREAMIRKAAYFRAASRGFRPGQEVEDWLAAETQVDRALARGEIPTLSG